MQPSRSKETRGFFFTSLKNPFFILFVIAAALLVFFFWKAILYAFGALVAIFVLLLITVKIYFKKPGLKRLFREKDRLLHEVNIAEKRYMRRKLSEADFNKIFKEKQKQLIGLEALIDQQYNKERKVAITADLQAVQAKKRHILQEMLEEKKRLIKEMDIAEKRYLKRKLDSKTYQALVQGNQEKLITLEAQIKQLYSEANIQQVMTSLKQRLSTLEKNQAEKKKKKKMSERERELQIAAEIVEQLQQR